MDTLGILFSFIFGLLIGSFMNCLAWRLYKDETILGRSYCPNCHSPIRWFDNIPLLSFFLLKGKCRDCGQKISWQYPVVELLVGLLFAATFFAFFSVSPLLFLKVIISISSLVLVFIFDFRWYLIPVSALVYTGAFLAIFGFFSYPYGLGAYIIALGISVVSSSLFFFLQYFLTKGRGIGEGDIWLGGFLGIIFVNLTQLIVAILSAYFIGSIVGLILIALKKKQLGGKLPLGVFLALGAIISIFFGHEIALWYWGLFAS